MIRPEVIAALTRWREALIGASAVAGGGWLWLASYGLPALLGAVAAGVGSVLLLSGIRLARFRHDIDSPGVVELDEGRITYLGPVIGGSADLDDIAQVAFRRTATGEAFWRLEHVGGRPLLIPEGAAGAERLLDGLAPLPGLDTGAMVRAAQGRTPGTVIVWQRAGHRALT
ncbi:hypothetical protein MWU52_16425 [Jannaschia sp. S6380]|uniref:hypothetical protein n=1 Tax=Jannaschia sp. S6380 TaxID=2926408 RepID=UPI001FF2A7A5|nr:hypothetical protein [Jannaschia sp. S6380]MCK0169142.1 hypothetical protein [Jannaschia sp. S6380]